ncbi:MAG: topoisomerase DNA-binding C4 zinc finger domain-containing protein, partial [Methylococcales bacterium]|nr:topoisomerase DNA-binding C4 zinc finger domain-containing protein [Methylococcales bacterium]
LLYREGRYGKFIGCSDFPKCRHTEQIIVRTGVACPVSGADIIEKKTRKGRVFYGCHSYPDCDWVSWKPPVASSSPDCSGVFVQKTKETVECIGCGLKKKEEEGDGGKMPASSKAKGGKKKKKVA